MTLENILFLELCEAHLINDATKICVTKNFRTYGAQMKRHGNWFQDQILNLSDEEVEKFEFDATENRLTVLLR